MEIHIKHLGSLFAHSEFRKFANLIPRVSFVSDIAENSLHRNFEELTRLEPITYQRSSEISFRFEARASQLEDRT